jgi:hypothetical protein
MKNRRPQSRAKSRKSFKRGTGLHPKNSASLAMRGGTRL